jgi:D-alanyl-D-alanine carboxypeptidase
MDAPMTRSLTRLRPPFSTSGGGITVLALVAIFAMAVPSALAGRNERPVPNRLAAKMQQILDTAVKSPKAVFPGTALYVSQPRLGTWTGAAGEANVDPATPMRASDTFRAGSIIKPFISTVVLQLAEEGKLALDDRLPAVLPQSVIARVADADRITVRMLLNHTSGIPEYVDAKFNGEVLAQPRRIWKVEEFLDRTAALPRAFAPGKRYAYSNTDYNLLGVVIERATGKPWRTVVRARIIDRLGLEHTSLPEPGHVSIGSSDAHGYELVNGKLRDASNVDPSMAGAAGGNALVTTTEDLSRFLDALLARKLFTRTGTLEEMLTFVKATDLPGKVGYGLGIERWEFPGGVEVIGHLGTGAGYRAFVGRVPAQKIDIAMAITAPDDPSPVLLPALALMVRAS